jgi:1,4-alpha-glucan branching enzyme
VDFSAVLGPVGRPLRTPAGPVLVPIDRELVDLVWARDGYPSRGAYADSGRRTPRRHRVYGVDGAPYDQERALRQAGADARAFVAAAAQRTRAGKLAVCALDTELLGDWWLEGVAWLRAVVEACEAAGVDLLPLDVALAEGRGGAPAPAPAGLPPTSWGEGRTLATWSQPAAGGLAWRQKSAELRALRSAPAPDAALRQLLALQASDWAFLISTGTAGTYPRERFEAHKAAFEAALDGAGGADPRFLAPHLARWALAAP